MFERDGFVIDPERWNGYGKFEGMNHARVARNLEALQSIEVIAQATRAKLLVVATPIIKDATRKFAVSADNVQLWNSVPRSLILGDAKFISIGAAHGYSDDLFVDFAHLNKIGAELVANEITSDLVKMGVNSRYKNIQSQSSLKSGIK
jgi:hypothetical protein